MGTDLVARLLSFIPALSHAVGVKAVTVVLKMGPAAGANIVVVAFVILIGETVVNVLV